MGCKNSSEKASPTLKIAKAKGQKTKILIVFYSTYGHVYKLAKAIEEGAKLVPNVEVDVRRVQETLTDDVLEKLHALEAKKQFENIPVVNIDNINQYDGLILGTPTRFGLMAGQMKAFIDSLGDQWFNHTFVGKAAGVFGCTGTQHGGQEMTLFSSMLPLLHLGFTLVGLEYADKGENEIAGGNNFGPTTIAGDGSRQPTEKEIEAARGYGKRVANVAIKLAQ